MALVDSGYSRFVRIAKVIFPLLALGLLSTLFLFSRSLDPNDAIIISDIDVEKIAREQILAAPRFSGITSDGSEILVAAESARPDPDDDRRLSANQITATLTTQPGIIYEMMAVTGIYDGSANLLSLSEAVEIKTSDGYQFTTENLTANLKVTELDIPSRITGTGPSGKIEAGNMTLRQSNDTPILEFKNGVKLVYEP